MCFFLTVTGVDLVSSVKKTTPNVEIILLTAHGNIPDGVQAIKNGAFDYITKGDDNNKIIPLVSRAVEKARMNVRLEKLEKKSKGIRILSILFWVIRKH